MSVKTYDPKEVALIVEGVQMSGFAEGSFITVSRNADAWSLQVGADGEGTRSKSNNKSGRIAFTLMQSSDSNVIMSALALRDEVTSSGAVPVLLKDNSGDSLYMCETAWVVKFPDATFETDATGREWVLETDVLVPYEGGN